MKKFRPVTPTPDHNRRAFLRGLGSTAGLSLLGWPATGVANDSRNYFSLGVASGTPGPDSVVLWTRLAPDPLHGGGMSGNSEQVKWTIASDPDLRRVIAHGVAEASPDWGHSVHVTAGGLAPAQTYYYRFELGNRHSPVGRTRTLPAAGCPLERARFAFCSCQEYEFGYYAAFRHMASEQLDFVLHLGDYIYEEGHINPRLGAVRQHPAGELYSLQDYRNRYALYKSDPDLQAAHAALPFFHMWDDHEVDNDWAGDTPSDPESQDREAFRARKALAAQAFYEHLPLPESARPVGGRMHLYRPIDLGTLASISLLDTRQYRSDQPCGTTVRGNPPVQPDCPQRVDTTLSMTGAAQERWLMDRLVQSTAAWNVVAQPGWFSQLNYPDEQGRARYHTDAWDGYPVQRQRVLDFLAERRLQNVVMLGGDWHINGVMDVKRDFNRPDSATLATEFCGTSISSVGPWAPETIANMRHNPHVRYIDGDHLRDGRDVHGYVVCEVDRAGWRADFRVLDSVKQARSAIRTEASFAVASGRPGATRLD